jgi:DNA-binding NtrC family response regulator
MNDVDVRVLLIEDDAEVASSLQECLQEEGFVSEAILDAEQGLALARASDFDVVLTDLHMPGHLEREGNQGLRVVRELHTAKPHLPVILMTAHHSTDTAIEATKVGAFDYILKPIHPPDLLQLVRNAAKNKHAASAPVVLGNPRTIKEAIVGRSRPMQEVYKQIGRVALTNATVLIRGETGTGKELVARALYQHSGRSANPFIVVNCAALPETLLESELFGHEAGAFTDAKLRRIGRFEQAQGGTIFLDEIGDMSLSTQVKLLRVLQERSIQRLGGKDTIPVDVRILAATHRNLEAAMGERLFRSDLYFRINDAVVNLPPLRERLEDVAELAQYFLERHAAELGLPKPVLESEALRLLEQQSWPGNVREFRSTLRRALLSARSGLLTEQTIRDAVAATGRHTGSQIQAEERAPESLELSNAASPFAARVAQLLEKAATGEVQRVEEVLVEEVERELYSQALRLASGNQSQAARWLGVSRPTFREKVQAYGLQDDRSQWRADGPKVRRRVLIIEDETAFADLLQRLLEEEGYQAKVIRTVEEALPHAERGEFDVILTDLYLTGASGLELVRRLRTAVPHLPVILMTGKHDTDVAIEATKAGAYDYFAKPDALSFEPFQGKWQWLTHLDDMIDQAISSKRASETVRLPGDTKLGRLEHSDRILGKTRVMQNVYKEIGRVAGTNVTVLIRGETGTGKELVARAVYHHSSRVGAPLIVINCAALPETLLESELFGHEAGAFTDAKVRRIGRFEQAQRGTIFLDEIGDMTLSTQVKLLRVLQEKTIQRLGGKETIAVDVRILAATHRDLEAAIEQGTFRSDLYFRLNEVVITLPPLRDRREDILDLIKYFAERDGADLGWFGSQFTDEAIAFLQEQPWPGNIRELRHVIRRALLIGRGYPISAAQVRRALMPATTFHEDENSVAKQIASWLGKAKMGQSLQVELLVREALERELYGQAFARAQSDQSQAARWLGVSRPTMRDKLVRYGLLPLSETRPAT